MCVIAACDVSLSIQNLYSIGGCLDEVTVAILAAFQCVGGKFLLGNVLGKDDNPLDLPGIISDRVEVLRDPACRLRATTLRL